MSALTQPVFVHEFASPINRYKALATRAGRNVVPVSIYEGRPCYATDGGRVRGRRPGYGFHNRVIVHFLDDGSLLSLPAGQWAKKAKAPPVSAEVAA